MSGKPAALLHLGCGFTRLEGWINADLHPTSATDMVFDAQERWPLEDHQIREIHASHMLEHVPKFSAVFREAWRVLEPNGLMSVRVPYGGHRLAWADPTHVKAWFPESFCFLQPTYGREVGNPQELEQSAPFAVAYVEMRLGAKWSRLMRNRLTRRLMLPWLEHIENAIEELWVFLYALKTEDAVQEFLRTRTPNTVPARYCMYRHHFEGRTELRQGEKGALVTLTGTDHTVRYGFDETIS